MSVRVVLVPRSLSVPPRYLLSALAHALILVVWAWAPTRTTRFEFKGDAMTVGLVAAPPSGGGARAVLPPAPTPPAPAPPPPEPKGPSLQEPKVEDPKEPPDKKKKEEKTREVAPSGTVNRELLDKSVSSLLGTREIK